MPDEPDMNEVITRGMLNEALAIWSGAIVAQLKVVIEEAIGARVSAAETRLSEELRQHSNANREALQDLIRALDDKYSDLPPRVARLEAKVFAPRRKRR